MKKSEKEDLRRLNKKQLLLKLEDLKKQKLSLEHRFRPSSGRVGFSDKGSPPIFKKVKKAIAIINTIINERKGNNV